MPVVKMTLVLWSGEIQVTYWRTALDAVVWRKACAQEWFESKLENA